jgi:hypothetical protein
VVYDVDNVDGWAKSHEYEWEAYHGHNGWVAYHWWHPMGGPTVAIANSVIYCVVGTRISGI